MRNLIIFLSTFTLTILIVIFASVPAHANYDGGGGDTGGGGSGGSWCGAGESYAWNKGGVLYTSPSAACAAANPTYTFHGWRASDSSVADCYDPAKKRVVTGTPFSCWADPNAQPEPDPEPEPDPDRPPVIPPPEKPSPDCDVCNAVYNLNVKITDIQNNINNNNYDMRVTVNNMQTTINNIDNSITDLSVNQQITNNNITNILTEINNLTTNIENNNITNNEIKNEINNINNVMNDYSLQLGDIKLAMGDIELALDNTNKLVLGLRPDIDFIKNNLVNGSPEGKDYTEQLNQIIELLKPCEPTAEKPCPDDDAIVKKLKEIQDYMEADFEPGTDSTAVEVEDLTDIELDRNLIEFGVAQCPPDNEFSTMVNGFSFSGGFKHKPLCDFFTLLSPFIKAFGGFSAALILGGGLRRG